MNKPLILVVEDDPSVRNLITTTLKTNDYRYAVAPNGSTAPSIYAQQGKCRNHAAFSTLKTIKHPL